MQGGTALGALVPKWGRAFFIFMGSDKAGWHRGQPPLGVNENSPQGRFLISNNKKVWEEI